MTTPVYSNALMVAEASELTVDYADSAVPSMYPGTTYVPQCATTSLYPDSAMQVMPETHTSLYPDSAMQVLPETHTSLTAYATVADKDHLVVSAAPTDMTDVLLNTSRSLVSCHYATMPAPRVSITRPPTILSRVEEFPVPQPPMNLDGSDPLMMTMVSIKSPTSVPKAVPMTPDQARLPRLSPAVNVPLRNRNTRQLGHFTRECLKQAKAQLAVPRVPLMAQRYVAEGQDVLSCSMPSHVTDQMYAN